MAEQYIEVSEGSGKKVSSVQVSINSQTVQIERATPGVGIVTLPETPQVSAVDATGLAPASAIEIQGRFYIICKNTFNDNTATASYRLAFYDSADVLIGFSNDIPITNLTISDGGSRYMGDNCIYSNDFGAKSIKFYITSISSGDNISIFVGVV